jgi:hypothetical protein
MIDRLGRQLEEIDGTSLMDMLVSAWSDLAINIFIDLRSLGMLAWSTTIGSMESCFWSYGSVSLLVDYWPPRTSVGIDGSTLLVGVARSMDDSQQLSDCRMVDR